MSVISNLHCFVGQQCSSTANWKIRQIQFDYFHFREDVIYFSSLLCPSQPVSAPVSLNNISLDHNSSTGGMKNLSVLSHFHLKCSSAALKNSEPDSGISHESLLQQNFLFFLFFFSSVLTSWHFHSAAAINYFFLPPCSSKNNDCCV